MRRFVLALAVAFAATGSLAGRAETTGPQAAPPGGPQAAPTPKSFVRPGLDSDAVQAKAAIRKQYAERAKGRAADQLFTKGVREFKDPETAIEDLGGAIAAGRDDAAVWLGFASAADGTADKLSGDDDADRKTKLTTWAPAAAYMSYQRATTKRDEAAALSVLGGLYAKREDWRPALDTYLASLKAGNDAAVRDTYDKLREEHGFKISDYKVDSDSAAPRVCFQFSEALAGGRTDLASFVAVRGMPNAAVSAEDQQLCVEGLSHGARYAITVREGLPSKVEETLLKSADYDIFVRDRAPQVHFLGKSYVLPRVGPEGLPVVSVNTAKVDVTVLRIGDRGLAPTVRAEGFLDQLYAYRFKAIANDEGAKVWTGTLDVEQRLNEDVTTAFPVLKATGPLQPGVYLLRAAPHADAAKTDDSDEQSATQWFVVSDLGLTALSGEDGVTAVVRSLATAAPLGGVELRLVARNNEVLAAKRTDGTGTVRFDPGLSRGTGGDAPELLVGSTDAGDYNFLDVSQTPFDLTDRGVKGRPAPKGLDAFVYAERGVYRSGETVFLTALLRDAAGRAAAGVPITLVVQRPDGVEDRRAVLADGGLGGHVLTLPLLAGAATGTWRVQAYADAKGDPIGDTSFLVEDYLPERLSFELKPQQATLRPGEAAKVATATRFLYGAPGKNLEITGEAVVEAAGKPAWPALVGYETGLTDEALETATLALTEPVKTDDEGRATVSVPIPVVVATRPTEAKLILRVGEPGGRAVERTATVPLQPRTALIGVKKVFTAIEEGGTARFDVVVVGPDGARVSRRGLHWSLYRLTNDYQFYNNGGHWTYERVKASRRIAAGSLDANAADPAAIGAPVTFGSHRLDLSSDDPSLPPTSVTFDVGFSAEASAQTPDLLEVTLDRADYKPGDDLRINVASRFAGEATLAIVNGRVRTVRTVDLKTGDNVLTVPVSGDWGTDAYALVLAHRPLDAAARRMPGRAVGLAWFKIDAAARALGVALTPPAKMRPRATLTIPVTLSGLEPGEDANVTVSAVDLGILNLTRYQTPDANDHFFGQHALGTDIRDVYGFLIDGLGIAAGGIRSGGDSAGELASEKPTQAPLARFSGIVKVGPDGTATVTFDIPAFNGTVRVAAVAWTATRAGSADADVIVRDPVVVAASLPRFLNLGDRARAHFDLDNVEGAGGTYVLGIEPHGPWFLPADKLRQEVKLDPGARSGLDVPLTAAGLGTARLGARLTGPETDVAQDLVLGIEPGSPTVYHRDFREIAPGASILLSSDLLTEFVPGSGTVSAAVSPVGGINVPALLLALDRYPVGCSEQIVSRAMPLLYVNRIAPAQDLAFDDALPARIDRAVADLLSRQTAEGAFGLWSAASEGDDIWLDSYVTDFLTRAKEGGHAVPQKALDAALDKLRNYVANNTEAKDDEARSLGYALYVLARNGRPVMGDLHYLAGSRLDAFPTPLAQAQLGAALALLGDRSRATQVFDAANANLKRATNDRDYRGDYGSRLRDAAAVLTLVAESGINNGIGAAGAALEVAQADSRYTSTQEEAWMVMAAQAVADKSDTIVVSVDGTPHTGAFYRTVKAAALDGKPVTLTNSGTSPIKLVLTTAGQLPAPEPAAKEGYALERHYYRLDGTEVDPVIVKQNDRLVVVLKVTEDEAKKARVLLTDPLPAGFEIDNPALVEGGSLANIPSLTGEVTPAHTEFRDDRFTAAFARETDQPAFFTVGYIVRAVTPGRFVHPPATVEDMYRPERFGRTGSGTVEVKAE